MAQNIPTNFEDILALQFDQPAKKRQKDYGLKLVKSLWTRVGDQAGYFGQRDAQWKLNAEFAKGKMDGKEFSKDLGISDKENWANFSFKNLEKIAPRYMKSLLGQWMGREETPTVNAVDILSQGYKEEQKEFARYRMLNKQKIAEMQQATGMKLEDGYVPEDEDELEMHYKVEFRLPEEMYFEKTIDEVFQNSNSEALKREYLSDLLIYGVAAEKIERLSSTNRSLGNRIRLRRCNPARCIYNVFESPTGDDLSIFGEVHSPSIADLRKRFSQVPESDWFKVAEKASAGKSGFSTLGSFQERYVTDFNRPYDDTKVKILDFEVKVFDKEYAVLTTNASGKEILVKKQGKPQPQNGEVLEDGRLNIYAGVWAVDTDIMLRWEVAPNQIRAYQNGIDTFFSYSVVCPDADGTLVPSFIEKGMPIVKDLIMTTLKIRQMKKAMEPDGLAVDIAGLDDVDIGTGAVLQPATILKIKSQTGILYWNSADGTATDVNGKDVPFKDIKGGNNIAQLNTLVQLYNHDLIKLNNEWGTNPDALGQPIPARRSNKVNENQIQAANNSTEYVYDSFIQLKELTASKVAMMLWDMVIFEANDYKGMDNIERELIDSAFDVNVRMEPLNANRERLQLKIDLALQAKLISLGQAIRLENMDNVKDAELYLIKLEKKAEQSAAANQQAQIESNAQMQQQSLEAKARADAYVNAEKAKAEYEINKSKLTLEGRNEIVRMVKELNVEGMKLGKPIPPELLPLVQNVLQSYMQEVADEKEQQAMAEEQAAAEQQAQQEQVPAEQMEEEQVQ